jgi:hypothetical protein
MKTLPCARKQCQLDFTIIQTPPREIRGVSTHRIPITVTLLAGSIWLHATEFVKCKTNGPTAESSNINFASLYDPARQRVCVKPSNFVVRRRGGLAVAEQLSRDASYEAVCTGPLSNAAAQEEPN